MSAWGAKGWGAKGKGKGAGKEGGGKGHELPRTRLSAEKFAGTVDAWKGKYGWIKPAEEIAHEKAADRNGNIFVAIADIMHAEKLDYGAPVKFHIFEDSQGLGAEEVEVMGPGTPGGDKGKGSSKGSKGKDAGKYGSKGGWGAGYGGKSSWGGASSWGGKGDAGGAAGGWGGKGGAKAGGWGVQTGYSKGAKGGKGEKGGKKGGNRGKGHLLERTRITAEKFAGTVNAWKGKYGWITPAEEIAHEKASKHNGGLFVGVNDLQDGVTELSQGQTVAFHIFEDSSGLGAEEVSLA